MDRKKKLKWLSKTGNRRRTDYTEAKKTNNDLQNTAQNKHGIN
jgi:hypothetical protein